MKKGFGDPWSPVTMIAGLLDLSTVLLTATAPSGKGVRILVVVLLEIVLELRARMKSGLVLGRDASDEAVFHELVVIEEAELERKSLVRRLSQARILLTPGPLGCSRIEWPRSLS